MILTQKQIDRFWSKVDIKSEDECWNWTACKINTGYGQFGINYKIYKAHRISWIIHNCDIPEGLLICHTCDNPSCCNPKHLFLGTAKDNTQDMIKKGRYYTGNHKGLNTGIKNGNTKLTEEQVLEIRQKYIPWEYTQKMLADEYGVGITIISYIINNKSWKHIL